MSDPAPVLLLLGPSAGGIRRHVAALARRLEERGRPVAVAGPAGVLDGLRPLDHVVPLGGARSPVSLRGARREVRALAGHFGLVHAHGLGAGLVAASLRRRPPLVATLHNLVLPAAAGAATGALRALEAGLPARVDRTIVVSAEMARHFTGCRGADRIRVVAPVSDVPAPTRPRAEVRARLGVVPGQPLVVCVARLHPQKGLDVLLAATALLRPAVPGLRVAIVGGGPLEADLHAQAVGLGLDDTVVFAGPSPSAAEELAAADVVVVPSRWEGWPLVVAEALHLERPVVATSVGAVAEVVVDGVTGTLVPPSDPHRLAEALEAVLADRPAAASMARAGAELLARRYRPDLLVDQVEATYALALGAA